jgi:hypothetical protein
VPVRRTTRALAVVAAATLALGALGCTKVPEPGDGTVSREDQIDNPDRD